VNTDADLTALIETATPAEARAAAERLRAIAALPAPDAASRAARKHALRWAASLDQIAAT